MIDVVKTTLAKYAVCAPIGGFGNHVRWLALLDPVYQFELTPLAEPRFKKILDPSRHISFTDIDTKLLCFQTQIYSPRRSWDNWIWMEYLYREDLDQVLTFTHGPTNEEDLIQKKLYLTIDPDLALESYFKLNSNLNHSTPNIFKKICDKFTQNAQQESSRNNCKQLNVDCLYQPTLDRTFYNSLIEYFELNDCYTEASQVHALWFDCHQRAQQEFVSYTNSLYQYKT